LPRQEDTISPFRASSEPDLVWIEPGFALGSRPYAFQREAVAQLGVRMVIALHEPEKDEAEAWQACGVRLVTVPTRDWVEIPIAIFDRVVELISSCLDSDTPVLLHCLAGLNRAPTVAAAALCHIRGMSVDKALATVKRARSAAKPTPEQEVSLRVWFSLRCRK
jgi:atypical dual specificity phosphatase